VEGIQRIPKEMLRCVMTYIPTQLQKWTEWHCGHLQDIIFRQ